MACLLSQRSSSQQVTLDAFFGCLAGSAELQHGASDRAFARACSRLHAPALQALSDHHPMTQITSSTLVLAVKDLNASRRFYKDLLGFDEDLHLDGWSFLSRDACKLRIGHCPDAVPMTQCQDHAWFAYLHVSDAAALFRELVDAKVEIWHALADKPWGFREFAIVTPDGHRIVFGQSIAP